MSIFETGRGRQAPQAGILEVMHLERRVRIGTRMSREIRSHLIRLFIKHQYVFTWSHIDMHGINRNVIENCLSVNLDAKKVWQKRRSFSVEKHTTIAEEVDRLLVKRSSKKPTI